MKQKAGIIIFVFALLWCIAWGLIVSIFITAEINTMTMEQLDETIWGKGFMMMLWGIGGVPLGTVVAGLGLLLYINAKGRTILVFTLGLGGPECVVRGAIALFDSRLQCTCPSISLSPPPLFYFLSRHIMSPYWLWIA